MIELLKLFWSFIQVGVLSFGGGMAAMPIIQTQVVEINGWLTFNEFINLITIAEMTPGPIAINAATFVGTRLYGVAGAVVATLGCILPSCIIVLTLGKLYFKYKDKPIVQGILSGLRPAIIALIATAGISIILVAFFKTSTLNEIVIANINYVALGLFCVAVFILRKFKVNSILVMIGCGIVGGVMYSIL